MLSTETLKSTLVKALSCQHYLRAMKWHNYDNGLKNVEVFGNGLKHLEAMMKFLKVQMSRLVGPKIEIISIFDQVKGDRSALKNPCENIKQNWI